MTQPLLLLNAVLPSIFELLSAYDLAHLYFCGTSSLQQQLRKHVTTFKLNYSAHRRIAWPRAFLPLFPALRHVMIGGHDPQSYPRVPDIDIRILPSSLVTLELHIANGLISLIDPSQLQKGGHMLHLLPLNDLFPDLQILEWKNMLSETTASLMLPTFDSFPQASMHTLKLSLPGFSLLDFHKLPTTLEYLSIDAESWFTTIGNNTTQLPSQLVRLELFHVSSALFVEFWPRSIEHLRLDFDGFTWRNIDSIDSVLGTAALPPGLKTFHLNAPMFFLGPSFCELLPMDLQDLRLFAASYQPNNPKEKSALELKVAQMEKLSTLYFCVAQVHNESSTPFIDEMPPNLVEFVVTAGPVARKAWNVEKMPKSLRKLCSSPDTSMSLCSTLEPQPSLASSIYYPNHDEYFPRSLLVLEDTILNFKTFPSTLTRLSLPSYSRTLIPLDFDMTCIGTQVPNVTDLSLCFDAAFDVLEHCQALPLITLNIDLFYGKMSSSDSPGGIDREKTTAFDFRCFPRLTTLHINPRFILATSRAEWLRRLPDSVTALSLVPARIRWTNQIPPSYYLESWIVFPALPRGLLKFSACISDLHFQEVFRMLPDHLTELYLTGLRRIAGAFGQVELSHLGVNPFTAETLDYTGLPLSLTKLMLPYDQHEGWPSTDFFINRPQLALTTIWNHSYSNTSPLTMPTTYTFPSNSLLTRRIAPQVNVLNSLSRSVRDQQHLTPPDAGPHCVDTAVRTTLSDLVEAEMKLMRKATSKFVDDEMTLDDIQRWLYVERGEMKAKMLKRAGLKKDSACNVS